MVGCATDPPPARAPRTTAPSAERAPAPKPVPVQTATDAPVKSEPELAPECVGKEIDLDAIFKRAGPSFATGPDGKIRRVHHPCAWMGQAAELAPNASPERVTVAIDPQPLSIASGSKIKLTAKFENVTSVRRTLLFRGCSEDPLLAAKPLDSEGERADLLPVNGGCGVSLGCQTVDIAIALEPGGVARSTGDYRAMLYRLNLDSCVERVVGSLKPGSYDLEVTTNLLFLETPGARSPVPRRVRTPLTVRSPR
jgi:hypothetical protein